MDSREEAEGILVDLIERMRDRQARVLKDTFDLVPSTMMLPAVVTAYYVNSLTISSIALCANFGVAEDNEENERVERLLADALVLYSRAKTRREGLAAYGQAMVAIVKSVAMRSPHAEKFKTQGW